jgi:hypothetical protein
MAQRQLDLRIPTYEPNTVPIGKRHIVEIRNKGRSIGIYTLSLLKNKKRGVSLPIEAWILLQQQLALINLNIQFASGTVGVDVLQGVQPMYDGSLFPSSYIRPEYGYNNAECQSVETLIPETVISCEEGAGEFKPESGGGVGGGVGGGGVGGGNSEGASEGVGQYGYVSFENECRPLPYTWHVPTKFEP